MQPKTVVFRAHMLLGDAIYACATIGLYAREHPTDQIVVECLNEYPQEVYTWLGPNVRLSYATDEPFDIRYDLSNLTGAMHHALFKKQGIWISMGELVGLPTDSAPHLDIPQVEIPEEWKGAIVISPFSRSCTSHTLGEDGKYLLPNKCLPVTTWMPLIRYLRRRTKVLFVSARQERMDGFQLDESERVAGYSLATVAAVFAQAQCVISVDNGLARLATLSGGKTLTLMPDFLSLEVFAPAQWNIATSFVAQIQTSMEASSFTAAIKMVLRDYMGAL